MICCLTGQIKYFPKIIAQYIWSENVILPAGKIDKDSIGVGLHNTHLSFPRSVCWVSVLTSDCTVFYNIFVNLSNPVCCRPNKLHSGQIKMSTFLSVAASQHTDLGELMLLTHSQFCKMTKATDHLSLRTCFFSLNKN